MKTIRLTGRLAKKFGSKFSLDIHSPAEAIRALCTQIAGFEAELLKGAYRVLRVYADGAQKPYNESNLAFALGTAHTLRIEPVAQGAKQGGLLQIVFGVALVGAAFLLTGGVLSGTAITLFGSAITGTQLALVGGLMAIAGASAMMAPTMEQATDDNKEKSSAMISTPSNKTEQGHPIPLVYGRRVFVGSVLAGYAVTAEEFDDGE